MNQVLPAAPGSAAIVEPATWRDLNPLRSLEKICFPVDVWPLFDMIGVLTFPGVVRLKATQNGEMVGFIAADIRRAAAETGDGWRVAMRPAEAHHIRDAADRAWFDRHQIGHPIGCTGARIVVTLLCCRRCLTTTSTTYRLCRCTRLDYHRNFRRRNPLLLCITRPNRAVQTSWHFRQRLNPRKQSSIRQSLLELRWITS